MKSLQLRIHYLQHVTFEGLGCIEDWVNDQGHKLSSTKLYNREQFSYPLLNDIDWLIVMGGPMSVYNERDFPWIREEKEYILQAINAGKIVLGICLGAQLIASAMGADVFPNTEKEIGWFPVNFIKPDNNKEMNLTLPEKAHVFHWHGDTYSLPSGADNLAYSQVTKQQMFLYNNRVLGIQFHFELTSKSLSQMVENMKHELVKDNFVQQAGEILKEDKYFKDNNKLMFGLLEFLEGQCR